MTTWQREELAVDVWKYYGGVGGADKDRMVNIVTWLLGFSGTILGFRATGYFVEPRATALLAVFGMLVSGLAAFVALLYGGYATWNWGIADQMAKSYDWRELKPDYNPISKLPRWGVTKIALCLAKPRPDKIAYVFWVFFIVSLLSLSVQIVMLCSVDWKSRTSATDVRRCFIGGPD